MKATFPVVCLLAVLGAGPAGTAAEEPPKSDDKANPAKDAKKEAKSAKTPKTTKPKTPGKKPAAKPRPRLVVSSAGLRLEEPGRAPRRFASPAEIAREAPGTEGVFAIEGRDTAD